MQSSSVVSEEEKQSQPYQVEELEWRLGEFINSMEIMCKDLRDVCDDIRGFIKTFYKISSITAGGAIGGIIYSLYPITDAMLKGNSKVSIDPLLLPIFIVLGGTAGYLAYRRHYRNETK